MDIRHEMKTITLGDERLNRRASTLLGRLADQPQGPLVGAMQGRAELDGAYRFWRNEAVAPTELLAAHAQASRERLQGCARVLCIADTSFISYGHRAAVPGLGPHHRIENNGFFLHPTFAVSAEGVNLGTVHWHSWVRDARLNKRKTQARRPVQDKESMRWLHSHAAVVALQAQVPDTRLTYVTDREGDSYEMLAQAAAAPVDFIIRAQSDRLLPDGRRIGQPPPAAEALGTVSFALAGRPGRTARQVTQTVWAQRQSLSAQRGGGRTVGVEVTVVWAQEQNPPAGEPPVQWILLTNLPVTTLAQAAQIVDWYRLRWHIEMLFDALKNVCGLEDSQLRDGAALQNLCALHLIVAWRILHLQTLARHSPQLPATSAFAAVELEVLARALPAPAPRDLGTLHDAVIALAMLGGYLARKHDQPPGLKILARAYQRLCLLVAFYQKISTNKCV